MGAQRACGGQVGLIRGEPGPPTPEARFKVHPGQSLGCGRRPWEPAGGVLHPDQGPERPPGGEDFKPVPLQDSAAAGQNPVHGGAEKSGELGPG